MCQRPYFAPCSITRQDLGPYKLKVIVIPTVYFVTIIIVDFIMYSVRGRTAFNVADFDKGDPIELRLSSWERLLLIVCAVSLVRCSCFPCACRPACQA
jgi:hypothetical protein